MRQPTGREVVAPPPRDGTPPEYTVEAGTRILMRLTNAVNTKHTKPGDRVYLETVVPVFVGGKLVISPGSYVAATVSASKEAGRGEGRAAPYRCFDSHDVPNRIA